MAMKKIDPGPTALTTARNVRRFRRSRGLGYAELSRRLTDLGREIPPLGLRHLEAGARRVDVDDLVALAIALRVSPLALLLPLEPSRLVERGDRLPADRIWMWGHGHYPLSGDPVAFVGDSNPVRLAAAEDLAVSVGLSAAGVVGEGIRPLPSGESEK
jgi:transcriptional regulator with XRE-family HTH domain